MKKAMFIRYYRSINGNWYWSLVAANNRIVADGSEGYKTRAGVKAAIERVRAAGLFNIEVKEKA